MNLRYINISVDPRSGYDVSWRYGFTLNTRFISHYMSTGIRRVRYVTDGTFDMISIAPMSILLDERCRIVPLNALRVDVPFEITRYEAIKGSQDCEYYLELLREGFVEASKFKSIPLEALLRLMTEFKANGCRNEWHYKTRRFKEKDLDVLLECKFTTSEFRLVATISRMSTKSQLCSGTLLMTPPDEIYFEKLFKDIVLDGRFIVVTDATNSPRFYVDLDRAFSGEFHPKMVDAPGKSRVVGGGAVR